MTLKAWCETNGINIKTYYYWLHKIRVMLCDGTETHVIVPLQIHQRDTNTAITVNIGSISIKITDGTSSETITAVFGCLQTNMINNIRNTAIGGISTAKDINIVCSQDKPTCAK